MLALYAINFAASLGTALTCVFLLQQVSADPRLSESLTRAHRVGLGILALLFFANAFEKYDGDWLKPFLAVGCCVFFVLRAVARHRYPPRQAVKQSSGGAGLGGNVRSSGNSAFPRQATGHRFVEHKQPQR